MKKLLVVGVMTIGLGFTSALSTQREESDISIEPNPARVNNVVYFKKDKEHIFLFLNKLDEVKKYYEFGQLAKIKKREDERRREKLKKQQEELERKRIEEERRQRELAKKRSQQLAALKERQKRKEREKRYKEKQEVYRATSTVRGTLNIEFSYYVAMCDSGCTGTTATGIDVRNTIYYQGMRIVATDPRVIPTWSIIQFEINGQTVRAIALDTGGYIKGNKIDMLVGSVSEANRLGRQMRKVEILRYGK
ncbi:3D domain-containing protein [Bacillus haynesii]|uniref:3D domain-containing protein n=1 Tax=Bacillus haynesii TaxID=1925021 RepID=UPI00227E9809|nr:3D domain-containing protein [Bacillus haynesii]MCY8015495.1 3D domain-containing protein [Bacillus haynesii]